MRVRVLITVILFVQWTYGTNFLPHGTLLSGLEDPEWFERNIPIIDVPGKEIQDVYYYRWQSYKEHLTYTSPQFGFLSTEFLGAVGYAGPYGAIVAAAGHHIVEGRWLRDQKPGKDLVNFWLAGPGQWSKAANDALNPDTYDWAHQYSFWAASSVWQQYLTSGDRDFAVGHLDNLVRQYRNYDNHFNADLGLYWQAPVWDASEYTPSSYQSSDPYHGGYGYRPTINAYQYGDAEAISAIAALKGDTALSNEYARRASSLISALHEYLWDSSAQFFKHRQRDSNPSGALLDTREYAGFIPWAFNMALHNDTYSTAFSQLKDRDGFASDFGPTTSERRRTEWFMKEAYDGCCRWNGPSWPFATSQMLSAAANLLNNYPKQSYFSKEDYANLLSIYAKTQYKNGKPYIAEAHEPDKDKWLYDSPSHSEDYNHSTFIENVIAELIGLRAKADNMLVINPLTPKAWTYFALENAAYHGHNVTLIWDQTGTHYGQGQGLRVWVDDSLVATRTDLGPLTVAVGAVNVPTISDEVNIGTNPLRFEHGSQPISSYESGVGGDNAWNILDGTVLRLGIPQNSRWTSYGSRSTSDWIGINLRRAQSISKVTLYFYDDAGGVRLPTSYDLQYWTGSSWNSVTNQVRSGAISSNAQIIITFPEISTSMIRVLAPNRGNGIGWGLSEFEVWTDPIFQIRNINSGKLMAISGMSTESGANVVQFSDNGTRDHLWRFNRTSGGWFKIKNINSGKVLAVLGASTQNSSNLQQTADTGANDQLWRVEDKGRGYFIIKNKNSGLVAAVDRMSKEDNAQVVQFADSGTADHLWTLLAAVPMA